MRNILKIGTCKQTFLKKKFYQKKFFLTFIRKGLFFV